MSREPEKDGRTQVFYAHRTANFERGTNENRNGIVRRFLPKGSSFSSLTAETVTRVANYINNLGSSIESFIQTVPCGCVIHLTDSDVADGVAGDDDRHPARFAQQPIKDSRVNSSLAA